MDYPSKKLFDTKYAHFLPQPYARQEDDLCVMYPNQLNNAFQGVCGLQAFAQHSSSSRMQMQSQHVATALVCEGADERSVQTEMDKEYAKYTFNVEMPEDGKILRVFKKYPPNDYNGRFGLNPLTTVLYETASGEIGMFNLTEFRSEHQYFGFRYASTRELSAIAPGADFKKGTVFLKSPLVSDRGGWKFGVSANVALMSHRATAEDSMWVSDAYLKKLRFRIYKTRSFEYGADTYAKNTYGTADNYKIMPDIGEYVADHGYLCVLGRYDDSNLSFVEQSVKASMQIDDHDIPIHVGPGGRIVNVEVYHDWKDDHKIQPDIDGQALAYHKEGLRYYRDIYNYYLSLKASRGQSMRLTPELHRLLVFCQSQITQTNARLIYRKKPIDRIRVVVTVEYIVEPHIGYKITGLSGDKGVICRVTPQKDMPQDADGVFADIAASDESTVGRNNSSRLYEHMANSIGRQVHWMICSELALQPGTSKMRALRHIQDQPIERIEQCWKWLLDLYQQYNMDVHWAAQNTSNINLHIAGIVADGLNYFWPTDNEANNPVVLDRLNQMFKPTFGPVRYREGDRYVMTKSPVRIAKMYIMLLEKIGDTWSACASSKVHHNGLPSQTSQLDKYRTPARENPVRGSGESELRIITSYAGAYATAEILDRNASPMSHRIIVDGILSCDNPADIECLIDRKVVPYGGAKPLQMFKHWAMCEGWAIKYVPMNTKWYNTAK